MTRWMKFRSVLIVASLVYIAEGALLEQQCHNNTDCTDLHAVCQPNKCKSFICQCTVGYVINKKEKHCDKASLIGEPCNQTTHCLPRNSKCNSSMGTCACEAKFQPTPDNFWCIKLGHKALGEPCNTNDSCGYLAECQTGKCACHEWHALWGPKERWLGLPESKYSQCENTNRTLNSCNFTTIAPPVDESVTPSSFFFTTSFAQSSPATPTPPTGTTAHAVSTSSPALVHSTPPPLTVKIYSTTPMPPHTTVTHVGNYQRSTNIITTPSPISTSSEGYTTTPHISSDVGSLTIIVTPTPTHTLTADSSTASQSYNVGLNSSTVTLTPTHIATGGHSSTASQSNTVVLNNSTVTPTPTYTVTAEHSSTPSQSNTVGLNSSTVTPIPTHTVTVGHSSTASQVNTYNNTAVLTLSSTYTVSAEDITSLPSTPVASTALPTVTTPAIQGDNAKERKFPLEAVVIPSTLGGLFLVVIWIVIIVAVCRRQREKRKRRLTDRSRNDEESSERYTQEQQGSFRQAPIPRPQLTLNNTAKSLYSGLWSPSQLNPYSLYDPYRGDRYFPA